MPCYVAPLHVQVFMNMPLEMCEVVGFTDIDDPYEPPLNCEIEIQQKDGDCPTPGAMAGEVVFYLEDKGYLQDH
ncbi:Uncharacterized protein TCM_026474 [Theobroma cacao]|uniref:Uncharacterized protein n=1 Tax=Theobroma cacao TaxID=3641 RepID=A0A061F1Q0_THECC|nr:Uncharacterized protein TCM_026474 [Theobroma cacao]